MSTQRSSLFINASEFANRPLPARAMRGEAKITIADNEVRCRAEPLSEIWWQGRQWAVTSYGIECRDGTYYIEAHRLTEHLPDWSWLQQVAGKCWVDTEDFATAYLVALSLHGVQIAPDMIKKAIRKMPPRRLGED